MNDKPKEERCACYELVGDNPNCPVHYPPKPEPKKDDKQKFHMAMHMIFTLAPAMRACGACVFAPVGVIAAVAA